LVVGGVVLVDQLTKRWAASDLSDGHVIDIVWTLRLNLVRNSGSAFSIGRGLGPVLGVVAVVVVLVLIRMGRVFNSPATALGLGAVLGGAIGNLADRVFRDGSGGFLGGYVIDFVDFQWWPVFNVADMAIVCGALSLAWFSTRGELGDATDDAAPSDPTSAVDRPPAPEPSDLDA
jgi:signal peptidase II